MAISSLLKYRDDGKIVPSTLSGVEMLKLGWQPSSVRMISWINDNIKYHYRSPYSLAAGIIPGKNFIAIVESADEEQTSSLLRTISGDGTSQLTISNTQHIAGHNITGQFEWFNFPAEPAQNILEIVFRPSAGSAAYSVGIDAATGEMVSARYIRS